MGKKYLDLGTPEHLNLTECAIAALRWTSIASYSIGNYCEAKQKAKDVICLDYMFVSHNVLAFCLCFLMNLSFVENVRYIKTSVSVM